MWGNISQPDALQPSYSHHAFNCTACYSPQTNRHSKNHRRTSCKKAQEVCWSCHSSTIDCKCRFLAGRRILFISLQILFPISKKTLLRCTDNTGPRFAPDLAATTDFKTGTIFTCPQSVLQSFGFILCNTETGALQYHHPAANNNLVLKQPFCQNFTRDLRHTSVNPADSDVPRQ